MKKIFIKDDYIKMNQLMKLCGMVGQGSDTKTFIDDEKIKLNGQTVKELRKKVYPGDIVCVEGFEDITVEEKEK